MVQCRAQTVAAFMVAPLDGVHVRLVTFGVIHHMKRYELEAASCQVLRWPVTEAGASPG